MQRIGFGQRLLINALVRYWRRRDPVEVPQRALSPNPTDNLQQTMNLVMPLADPSALGKAELVQALAGAVPAVVAGLDNTQIVHNGRFVLVRDCLCMFSVYDGDFANYIRDFILNIGEAFDVLLSFVADPPPVPVEQHPDAFIEWVRRHDAMQIPYWDITALNTADDPDLTKLPRRLVLLLDRSPNAQVFSYVAYPGVSAAEIREELEMGW